MTVPLNRRGGLPDAPVGCAEPLFEQSALRNVRAQYVRYAVNRAGDQGLDVARMLRLAGIASDILHQDDATVTPQQFSKLMSVAITTMGDELLGYGPAPVPLGSWNMMCHSTIHCFNLGEALRRLCKFFSLFRDGLHPRLSVSERSAKLAFHMPHSKPDYVPEFFTLEMSIFLVHRYINWLIKEYVPLNTLSYSLPRPAYVGELTEFFLTTLVQFEAPVTSLTFDRRFLQRPIRQSRLALDRFLNAGYLELFMARYAPVSWTSRIKALIGRDLNSVAEYEDIASRLAIHPQTLRRRLAEEDTTFRQLKVDVRREAALLLLQSTEMSVEQISSQTGFSQASAFTRAFTEWMGCSPRAFRDRNRRLSA